jgi:hypothetical protein
MKAATSGSSSGRQSSMLENDARCLLSSLTEEWLAASLGVWDNGCNECSGRPLCDMSVEGDQFSLSDSFPGIYIENEDSGCLSLESGGVYVAALEAGIPSKRPRAVLDLWSLGAADSTLERFNEIDCLDNVEFRFDGTAPRMFLPADLSRPIAPAAEPLASCSAFSSSSLRASLSHQNSHTRESRDRPLDVLCNSLIGGRIGVWLDGFSG